jgi:hypothetical protein
LANLRYLFGRGASPRVLEAQMILHWKVPRRDRWVGTLISGAKSSLCKSQFPTFKIFCLEKRQNAIQFCQRRNCQIWNIQRCPLHPSLAGCLISKYICHSFHSSILPQSLGRVHNISSKKEKRSYLHQSTCLLWPKQSCDCRDCSPISLLPYHLICIFL